MATNTEATGESKRTCPCCTDGAGGFRKAKKMLSELPADVEKKVKDNPLVALAIAGAIGFAGGILAGSRLMRLVTANVASLALIELGRRYLFQSIATACDHRAQKPAST